MEIWIALAVVGLVVALLVSERMPPDISSFLGVAILLATGIITTDEVLRAFSNPAPIAIAAMFVLSAGLDRTGAIDRVAHYLNRHAGRDERGLLLVGLPLVTLLSGVLNNTLVVVFFTPVFIQLAGARGTTGSRVLMPLSFAAILGGTCTLIGTSTNLVVSSMMESHPPIPGFGATEGMGMFEVSLVGLPLALVGLLYLLVLAPRSLPQRLVPGEGKPIVRKEYVSQVTVGADSALVGRWLDAKRSPFPTDVSVLEVARGGQRILIPLSETQLEAGDVLLVSAAPEVLRRVGETKGVKLFPSDGGELGTKVERKEAAVFEGIVGPSSSLEGRRLQEAELRQRFGVIPFAVHHHGRDLHESGQFTVPLGMGDTVLLLGTKQARERLKRSGVFMLLGESQEADHRSSRLPVAAGILLLLILAVAAELIPVVGACIIAAVLMVVTGCVEPHEAYRSIEWSLILLIIGMLVLGTAVEKTGAADAMVTAVIEPVARLGPGYGPLAILAAVIVVTSVLTEVISNTAAAALMVPIAFSTALSQSIDPRPLCFGVAIGASTCFASPIGYQTNMFVYGAGGYRFSDFLRAGLPLKLILCALATFLIPWFWPLTRS